MTDLKPGSLDALLRVAFEEGAIHQHSVERGGDGDTDQAFEQWRATLLATEGEKCNSCRLNDTWIDGRCTNCGKADEPEPIHLLERGNRQRTVCEIDIDGLFRNPEVTWTLANATCRDCRRGRGKGCFS
jgi:hypothetical protein